MKIGIVGTGNMGRILAEALIDGNAIPPSSITVTNRTQQKALKLKEAYPEISVVSSPEEVVSRADAIFICVKPHDIFPLLKGIGGNIAAEKCLISITSPVSVEQLESIVPCSVARAIPSITNRALAGISLLTYGGGCTVEWRNQLTEWFSSISCPVEIDNSITRVSSDIISCGPAFFSFIIQKFIEAAVKKTDIDQDTATEMASGMLIGLGELLKKEHYTLPALQEKVCVKGGVTGEGIKILEQEIGEMFEHLFEATHKKFEEDLSRTFEQFGLE